MLLDLKFSIGTLGLATGTLFSALYGMNLKNFIEESDFGFGAVSVTCFVISAVVCVYGLAKLRRIQRVRMWGEAGVGGSPITPLSISGPRANWRADSIEPVWGSIPGEGRAERMRRLKEGAAASTTGSSAVDAAAEKVSMIQRASNESSSRKDESSSKPSKPESQGTAQGTF